MVSAIRDGAAVIRWEEQDGERHGFSGDLVVATVKRDQTGECGGWWLEMRRQASARRACYEAKRADNKQGE